MKMTAQSSVAARKANTMLAIIKRGIQNKGNNRIKPLCKLLRHLHKEYSRPEKGAVKGGPGCQNYGSNKEQVNRIVKESGKNTSEGKVSKSSAKSKVTKHCIWNDDGLAVQYKQLEIANNMLEWLNPNK